MPQNIPSTNYSAAYQCATEEELLAFCNLVREAGFADTLDGLLPSKTGDPSTCLIANALNFKCRVFPESSHPDDRTSSLWMMHLPDDTSAELYHKVLDVVGTEHLLTDSDRLYKCVPLPLLIGNCARAFDAGEAFQEYAQEPIDA